MQAKKRFGQNFLTDKKLLEDLVNLINVASNDRVLEIGPGKGDLTKILVNICDSYFGIELDKDLLIFLKKKFPKNSILLCLKENLRKSFGYVHGLSNIGSNKFFKLAQEAGLDTNNPYLAETYDAAAIVILSNYEKFFSDQTSNKDYEHSVSNKPGIKIYPGDLIKAINLLKEGKLINYEGATNVEFDETGDTNGAFLEVDFKKRKIKSKKIR